MDTEARGGPGPAACTGAPSSVGPPPSAMASALAEVSSSLEQLRYSIETGGLADLDQAELIAVLRRFRRARDRVEAVSDRLRHRIPDR